MRKMHIFKFTPVRNVALVCTNQTLNKVKLRSNVVPKGYKTKENHETSRNRKQTLQPTMHGCKFSSRSHLNSV